MQKGQALMVYSGENVNGEELWDVQPYSKDHTDETIQCILIDILNMHYYKISIENAE